MISGIDVSVVQGKVNWAKVASDTAYRFVIVKCSEGPMQHGRDGQPKSWTDTAFEINAHGAKDAGLLVGAYHVIHPDHDPVEQAIHLYYRAKDLAQVPALDFELLRGATPGDALRCAEEFAAKTFELWGRRPLVYTFPYFWRGLSEKLMKNSDLGLCPLWMANYQVKSPWLPPTWQSWTVWQHDDGKKNRLPGGVPVDANYFNGEEQDLQDFFAGVSRSPTG